MFFFFPIISRSWVALFCRKGHHFQLKRNSCKFTLVQCIYFAFTCTCVITSSPYWAKYSFIPSTVVLKSRPRTIKSDVLLSSVFLVFPTGNSRLSSPFLLFSIGEKMKEIYTRALMKFSTQGPYLLQCNIFKEESKCTRVKKWGQMICQYVRTRMQTTNMVLFSIFGILRTCLALKVFTKIQRLSISYTAAESLQQWLCLWHNNKYDFNHRFSVLF